MINLLKKAIAIDNMNKKLQVTGPSIDIFFKIVLLQHTSFT